VDEADLDPDPLVTVAAWYGEAAAAGAPQPDAGVLATATSEGRPSARMVLVRGIETGDFLVFTGIGSRKADELAANPRAALVLYWHELRRQVRVEGRIEELDRADVETHWRTRPRGSRLAAWASRQSRAIRSRDELDRRYADAGARFPDDDVPLPDWWGGFRLTPETVELWEHRENRLHDRVHYRREGERWRATRLMP
jgi:pyridoxamine 5'-phosphate oxidase